ncbi:hypothetical protein EYF80_040706 [Liparis tanakae]|uniref:Uncharacterized protein n=1 Tax=Liparis tanakae TaxID=230148 RepID=A0A4Z2G779_9TELE|nr:hypothetical protein EYF80_040706 [Liparis tanakae]
MISRMVTDCDSTAGGLCPAMFTAFTLKLIFSPTGRPRTTKPCFSQSSWFATSHSVPERKENYMQDMPVIREFNNIAIQASSSNPLGGLPLQGARAVGHIVHVQAYRLAGRG